MLGLRIYSLAPPLAGADAWLASHPDWRNVADLGFNAVHWPGGAGGWAAEAGSFGLIAMGEVSGHGHVGEAIAGQLAKGIRMFFCRSAYLVPATGWKRAIAEARQAGPGAVFCAEAVGRPAEELWALEGAGFDFLVSSVAWWNGRDPWFPQQDEIFRRVGAPLGFPLGENDLAATERVRRYEWAAYLSAAVLMPAGFEHGGAEDGIREINRRLAAHGEGPSRRAEPIPRPADAPAGRVVIEAIKPEVDGGAFPAKKIVGDRLVVTADIFRDGHDRLSAALWLRQHGEKDWSVSPMKPVENDEWRGEAQLERMGLATFRIEAWTDHFGSWRHEVIKKREAGRSLALELGEGRALVARAMEGADPARKELLAGFLAASDARETDEPARAALLLAPRLAAAMDAEPDKTDRAFSPDRRIYVDRLAARFSAWYEMAPRSQGTAADRSSTFAECERRLPEIRALGFDVLYLLPIHPIGEVNRKGRNNRPAAEPGEPGSPYAIGNRTGGHTAVEPGLGTMEDFRQFHRKVREHGMELALDFAVQCAPDHPWVREHPRWFRRRPDGSIKYAENPPKKYEDIVNVDFESEDWRALWRALLDAVRFWMAEGVRIFRVDNPHTKPFAFWHWLIGEIQATDPDVIFLAEAFTRPKPMRHLAKIGFGQSYSYFTWRNTKTELMDYLTELTQGAAAEYYRPNFFANTPDILPFFLQTGGRAAFRLRLVLAATLSGVYGIYNGYELCEARALPGREEYDDSEKYAFKVWDWDRPGHIKEDIARLNRLRHTSPALQEFTNLRFHPAGHDAVLFYSKMTADRRDRIFVAVTLDPHRPVRAEISFPLGEMRLGPEGEFVTEELFSGWRQPWRGARHAIELDPAAQPALVWRVA